MRALPSGYPRSFGRELDGRGHVSREKPRAAFQRLARLGIHQRRLERI